MSSESDEDTTKNLFVVLRDALPKGVIEAACGSQTAIGLVPIVSDPTKPPSRMDVEQHFDMLSKLISEYPTKCPSLSNFVDGFVALDDFYRKSLSKSKTRKGQKSWANSDSHALRYLITYVFTSVRTQGGAVGARYSALAQLKTLVTTAAKSRKQKLDGDADSIRKLAMCFPSLEVGIRPPLAIEDRPRKLARHVSVGSSCSCAKPETDPYIELADTENLSPATASLTDDLPLVAASSSAAGHKEHVYSVISAHDVPECLAEAKLLSTTILDGRKPSEEPVFQRALSALPTGVSPASVIAVVGLPVAKSAARKSAARKKPAAAPIEDLGAASLGNGIPAAAQPIEDLGAASLGNGIPAAAQPTEDHGATSSSIGAPADPMHLIQLGKEIKNLPTTARDGASKAAIAAGPTTARDGASKAGVAAASAASPTATRHVVSTEIVAEVCRGFVDSPHLHETLHNNSELVFGDRCLALGGNSGPSKCRGGSHKKEAGLPTKPHIDRRRLVCTSPASLRAWLSGCSRLTHRLAGNRGS
jgi:hypothetical protein